MVATNGNAKHQLWLDIQAKTRTMKSISPKLEIHKRLKEEIAEMHKRLQKMI